MLTSTEEDLAKIKKRSRYRLSLLATKGTTRKTRTAGLLKRRNTRVDTTSNNGKAIKKILTR